MKELKKQKRDRFQSRVDWLGAGSFERILEAVLRSWEREGGAKHRALQVSLILQMDIQMFRSLGPFLSPRFDPEASVGYEFYLGTPSLTRIACPPIMFQKGFSDTLRKRQSHMKQHSHWSTMEPLPLAKPWRAAQPDQLGLYLHAAFLGSTQQPSLATPAKKPTSPQISRALRALAKTTATQKTSRKPNPPPHQRPQWSSPEFSAQCPAQAPRSTRPRRDAGPSAHPRCTGARYRLPLLRPGGLKRGDGI